jgi:3D (Asp-Asp-Asp) domain-containing protein
MGTKFYIEGLGYVVAMDTGGAIKGKYRFDYAVFDRQYAKQLGRRKYKVYLVKED